jgi:FkbM family methyltransferase
MILRDRTRNTSRSAIVKLFKRVALTLVLLYATAFLIAGASHKYHLGDIEDISAALLTISAATAVEDSSKFKNIHPLLKASLLRSSGGNQSGTTSNAVAAGWEINPVSTYPNYECKWIDFTSTTGKTTKFCGHSDPDPVTWQIINKGRFHHCNILPSLWNNADKTEESIYLEIGANIGSCVVEMLLSTDAKVIAFEPHPKNLFVLLSTIRAMEQSYQDRVVIVPVALGAESAIETIYAANGNMGNSVVGKIIKDNRKQEFKIEDQHSIYVERLDSIISPNAHVAFSKMDAQGFECNIVSGFGASLPAVVRQVKFEVSKNHLVSHGCLDLLSRFRGLGYTVYRENGIDKVETGEHDQFQRMTELIAKRDQ